MIDTKVSLVTIFVGAALVLSWPGFGLTLGFDATGTPAQVDLVVKAVGMPNTCRLTAARVKKKDVLLKCLGSSSSGVAKGDFNGDGFADLAIGMPYKDNPAGTSDSGAVIVIYGSADGLSASSSTVRPAQFWSQRTPGIPGTSEIDDKFGSALASGDFNNDKFSDLAIGAPGDVVVANGIGTRGRVVVIYGSPNGVTASDSNFPNPQSFAISDLDTGNQMFFFAADTESDVPPFLSSFGSSLAWGDFNGDGIGDLAVGSPHELLTVRGTNPLGPIDSAGGAVGIIFGAPPGSPGLPHGGLSKEVTQVFTGHTLPAQTHPLDDDTLGLALAAGDFLGNDKISDLAVGVPGSPFPRTIVCAGLFCDFKLTSPNNRAGAVQMLRGSPLGLIPDAFFSFGNNLDKFGRVLAAGDFNGDGIQELAVGVPLSNVAGPVNSGAVIITDFGSGAPKLRQVFNQDGIFGEGTAAESDLFGASLASGDFNGDGKADLAIGVPNKDVKSNVLTNLPVTDAGEVNVIYGSSTGLTNTAGPGVQIWHQEKLGAGLEAGDHFGASLSAWNFGRNQFIPGIPPRPPRFVATADLVIGVPFEDVLAPGTSNPLQQVRDAGAVHVIYGSSAGLSVTGSAGASQLFVEGHNGVPSVPVAGDAFGTALY